MSDDLWLAHCETLRLAYTERFATQVQVQRDLTKLISGPESPVAGVVYEIQPTDPLEPMSIGLPASGPATEVRQVALGDHYGATCRLSIWTSSARFGEGQLLSPDAICASLIGVMQAFWKGSYRDAKAKIPSTLMPETQALLDASIAGFLGDGNHVFLIFCDLDHFREINEKFGMEFGDRVIAQFAAVLDVAARPGAIALHRSGDEFVILCPAKDAEVSIQITRSLLGRVADQDFGIGSVRLASSAAISAIDLNERGLSYAEIEERASKTLKPAVGVKLRGKIRFDALRERLGLPSLQASSLAQTICIIKSNPSSERPFESPWLNVISNLAFERAVNGELDRDCIEGPVKELVEWISPDLDGEVVRTALPAELPGDFSAVFSPVDVLLSAAHGILRARMDRESEGDDRLRLKVVGNTDEARYELRLMPDDSLVMGMPSESVSKIEYDLGGLVLRSASAEYAPQLFRRALLVKVGQEATRLPTSVFSDVITVDDRPAREGGLPDFWESSITRVIAAVTQNPNIAAVYVWGNAQYARRTVEKLSNADSWLSEIDSLTYKTGMPPGAITNAVGQLRDKVKVMAEDDAVILDLAEVLRPTFLCEAPKRAFGPLGRARFLRRGLVGGPAALTLDDGFRVRTPAEAYPLLLEIVRHPESRAPIIDEQGREVSELLDFKLVLTAPEEDIVPAFYAAEQESLEGWFQEQFVEADGIFRRQLAAGGRLQAIIQYLANSISDPARRFGTRRAVLVTSDPEAMAGGEETGMWVPQLISVRVFPRLSSDRVRVYCGYTWRSQEALVGFPYSLYGSVRFSQWLINETIERLEAPLRGRVELGEVTYVAHSVHMFMDEWGQYIARKIVDDVGQ